MPSPALRAVLVGLGCASSHAALRLRTLRTPAPRTAALLKTVRCQSAFCAEVGETPQEVATVVAADPAEAAADKSVLSQAGEAAEAVYRFSRPHTIRGTLLACFTGVARALSESPIYLALLPTLLPRAMLGVLALLLGNLFIVGINQIYDVEIDVVNKPFLPIAAGRISPRIAWGLVLGSGAVGLAIVKAFFNPFIFGL